MFNGCRWKSFDAQIDVDEVESINTYIWLRISLYIKVQKTAESIAEDRFTGCV